MDKALKLIAILSLLCASAQAQILRQILQKPAASATPTWALVQHPLNAACSTGSLTCVVTLTQSIGTGNLLVAWAGFSAASALTITGLTGQTTTTCTACSSADGNSRSVISYTLTSVAQATSATVTLSGSGATPSGSWQAELLELSCTNCTSKTLDSGATPSGARDQTTVTTTPAGVTLTIAGTSDAIVQANFSFGTVTAAPNCMSAGSLTAGWVCDAPGGDGFGWLLNTAVVATPTWAQTSAKAVLSAIAFTANP